MFNDSIIKKSGQWWKAHIAFWGLVAGGGIMFIGLANLDKKELAVSLALVGVILGLASFIYGCLSIRCPNCKARWIWLGVSGKSSNEWVHWLLSRSQCPECNYSKNT